MRATNLIQGQWNSMELVALVDSGAPNDGTINFYVNGGLIGSAITGLDQGAITQASMGAMGIEAGTTAGLLLFDEVIGDDLRISPLAERIPSHTDWVTHDQHVAVGPGCVDVAATSSSTDLEVLFYDTDDANTGVTATPILTLRSSADETVQHLDLEFRRGLFVDVGGTNPQVWVTFKEGYAHSVGRRVSYAMDR